MALLGSAAQTARIWRSRSMSATYLHKMAPEEKTKVSQAYKLTKTLKPSIQASGKYRNAILMDARRCERPLPVSASEQQPCSALPHDGDRLRPCASLGSGPGATVRVSRPIPLQYVQKNV